MPVRTTAQPIPRPTLVYEENWEEHLTTLGPGASHWLFTGNLTDVHDTKQRTSNPFAQTLGDVLDVRESTDDYASQRVAHQQPGDVTPDFATPASSVRGR